MEKIVLATFNKGKVAEFRSLLAPLNISLLSYNDCGVFLAPDETGNTFLENARIKAHSSMKLIGLPTLADDSGLIVDALSENGEQRPGVHSARYGMPETCTDEDRNAFLLRELGDNENRSARFVCSLCLCFPGGREFTAEGVCEGVITNAPIGEDGFGYDPLFLLPEYGKTLAQLSPEQKNSISHRYKAVANLIQILKETAELR